MNSLVHVTLNLTHYNIPVHVKQSIHIYTLVSLCCDERNRLSLHKYNVSVTPSRTNLYKEDLKICILLK